MDNGDIIRKMTNEELAHFLAHDRFSMAKPVFDYLGYGIEEQAIEAVILRWLNQNAQME